MDYDDEYETVFPLPLWFLLVVAVMTLSACAQKEALRKDETQVCFLQAIGRTSNGLHVVRQMCLTEEQFAESQK